MSRINYHHSEETKRKISIANSIAMKGRKLSKETKRKMSEARKGSKSYTWKGGISNPEVRAGRIKPERCELCGEKSVKICFDHDHATGKFRGWICTKCNVVLGMVKDDIEQLERLKIYLKNKGYNPSHDMQLKMFEEALENSELIKLSE